MGGNKLEKDILSIFDRDISALMSINQVSKTLKKAYPHINAKVNQLIKEGVLNKTQVGRSHLCSINLDNEKAIALLTLTEIEKKDKNLARIKNSVQLKDELSSIRKQFKVVTILMNENSLVFILDHLFDREAIKNLYTHIRKFSLDFFDIEGFQKHALSNPETICNYSVLYSCEKYFEIISDIKDKLTYNKFVRGDGK